jgi:hypothetical protein
MKTSVAPDFNTHTLSQIFRFFKKIKEIELVDEKMEVPLLHNYLKVHLGPPLGFWRIDDQQLEI